jgi:hypothetical protein
LSPSLPLPLITSEDGIINNTKIPEDESAGFELFQQHFSLNFRRERRRQLHIKASQTWRRMSQQQKDQYRELARQQQTNRLGQEVKNFNPYAQFIAEFAKRFHIQYSESAESLKAWHKLKEPEKLYFSNLAALKRRAKVKKSFPMQQRESARGFDLFVMGFRHRAITSSSSESEPSRARAIETWHRLKNGGDKQSTGELEEIMQIGRKVWQARRAVSQDTATVANNDTKLFRRNNFFQSVYRWYFAWRVMEELAKIKAAEEQVYIAKFSRILWQIDSEWNEAQVRCAGIHSYANLKSDNCSKVIEI